MNGTRYTLIDGFAFIGTTRVGYQIVFQEKREEYIIFTTDNCNIVPAIENFSNIAFLQIIFVEAM